MWISIWNERAKPKMRKGKRRETSTLAMGGLSEGHGLSRLLAAIEDPKRVSCLTHTFYRYPARFSPIFARAAIEAFTSPGDLVLDPFMGGGTTLVEASSIGRQ